MKVVKAPSYEFDATDPIVFLSGSIEMGKAELWQDRVVTLLEKYRVTILNPRRDDWDSSWTQSINNPQFKEQVEWELQCITLSDYVLMYFDPATKSPISLLELGILTTMHKAIVCCPEGFWRKGNVDIVCERWALPNYNDLNLAVSHLKSLLRLEQHLEEVKK